MNIRTWVCAVAFGSLLVPLFAQADGMVIAPPDYWMEETGQRAVIFHEKGVETLVVSTSFQGDAKDFAWIVPTPSKPEVSKGTQEVFTNLQRLTQVTHGVQIENVGGTLGLGADSNYRSPVTVIEEKQVDYYDVAVLAATDKDALSNWLKEKGYNFPESASYLLQEYINNQWYFVAMRVNPESLSFTNVNSQLRSGGATPVVLRFATERIVYPLRISSAIEKQQVTAPTPTDTLVTDEGAASATFVPGKFGKAVTVGRVKKLYYRVGAAYPNQVGTIAANIKLRAGSGPYRSIVALHDPQGNDRMQFRLGGSDSGGYFVQFIQYPSTGGFVAWRTNEYIKFTPETNYHVAVTWAPESRPQIYINGEAKSTVPAYGETTWAGKDAVENSVLVVGGRATETNDFDGDIDDLVILNNGMTAPEVAKLAADGADGTGVSVMHGGAAQGSIVAFGSFDDTTKLVNGAGVAVPQLTRYPTIRKTTTIAPTRSQTITLYVLANERKDATGFSTRYANWFPKTTVRDLAFASDGAPLLPAESKKLFVTVLTRTVSGTGTLEDVFFRTATSQATMGTAPGATGADVDWKFWVFVGGCATLSGVFLVVLLWRTRSRGKPQPPQPLQFSQ